MVYYVYILWSPSLKRYYVGFSQFHAKRRRQHCREQSPWTSRASDWDELWCEKVAATPEARALERRIKAR